MLQQVAFQSLKVAERDLRFDELEFHQSAGRIVYEDE